MFDKTRIIGINIIYYNAYKKKIFDGYKVILI